MHTFWISPSGRAAELRPRPVSRCQTAGERPGNSNWPVRIGSKCAPYPFPARPFLSPPAAAAPLVFNNTRFNIISPRQRAPAAGFCCHGNYRGRADGGSLPVARCRRRPTDSVPNETVQVVVAERSA